MKTHSHPTTSRLAAMAAAAVIAVGSLSLGSCKDNVDESDIYTFTGKTVKDFLDENPDDYSMYSYILTKVQLSPKSNSTVSDLLSARGNYTCFVPDNQSVQSFLDSVYHTKGFDVTQISDSIASYIARNSIIDNGNEEAYLTTAFDKSPLEKTNMEDRYITVSFDTVDGGTYINERSLVTKADIKLTNGVIHEVSSVLQLSTATLPALISQADNTHIFSLLLDITSWTDSMQLYRDDDYEYNHEEYGYDEYGKKAANPKHRYYGYTAFVETDQTFHDKWGIDLPEVENGIVTNRETIVRQIEERCRQYYSGSSTDYRSQDNVLNQFVSYHLIGARIPADKLVIHYAEIGFGYKNESQLSIDCFEYYETMGRQRRLVKLTEGSQTNGKRINRYVSERNLKDYSEVTVPIPGILISETNGKFTNNALNGFYYPIDDILVYSDEVVNKVLNERLRFDISSLMPELITNGYRRPMSSANATVHIPTGYFKNFDLDPSCSYNYLSGFATTWPDFQGDEHNVTGQYDMTIKLPPVPFEGTWEIRWAVPTFDNRGMAQLYFGTNKSNLKAIGLPLDLRLRPTNPAIGWEADTEDEDLNDENDKVMRNHGYMKPPLHDGITKGGAPVTESLRNTSSYKNYLRLRKIIYTGILKPSETYYLRIKSVLEDTQTQFVMDWMEYAPKNIYNGIVPEDKW